MKNRALQLGAFIAAAAMCLVAVAPGATAAEEPVSQATAQALQLSVAGTDAVSQKVTAINLGEGEKKNDANTIPHLIDILPQTSMVSVGVAPQNAGARDNGTSFACAGITGSGGGIVNLGNEGCAIDGSQVKIHLADLNLGEIAVGKDGVLGGLLNQIPVLPDLLNMVTGGLDGLLRTISGFLDEFPVQLNLNLSVISSQCTATPTKAEGLSNLANAGLSVAFPMMEDEIHLVKFPVNPAPNTKVVTNPGALLEAIVNAVTVQLNEMLFGIFGPLGGVLKQGYAALNDALLSVIFDQLQVLLKPIEDFLLSITLNEQKVTKDGRAISVTALNTAVLPIAAKFAGGPLLGLKIGEVSCGSNHGPYPEEEETPPEEVTKKTPPKKEVVEEVPKDTPAVHIPTRVPAGVASSEGSSRNLLLGVGLLLTLGGAAGAVGFRRVLR